MKKQKEKQQTAGRIYRHGRKYKGAFAVLLAGTLCGLSACGSPEAEAAGAGSAVAAEADAGQEAAEPVFSPEKAAVIIPAQKEEIVSVQADAFGAPKKIEVSGTLSGFAREAGTYLEDVSGLTDLKNAHGEEAWYAAEDGTVYWENLGEDIHYEGIADRELPVEVKVRYFLDGKEQTPEQMKGKSGEVRIRFDYENKTRQKAQIGDTKEELTVPFLAVSLVALPEETFHDVEISRGKIMMVSGERAAVGYALTGLQEDLNLAAHEQTADIDLPSYVEITAQTDDFSLDFTATMLTSGLFKDMDEERLTDFDDTVKDMDDLEEGVDELEEAAGKLADGTTEMKDYLDQYVQGVDGVAGAIGTINTSLTAVDLTQLSSLHTALQQAAGAAQLSEVLRNAAALSGMGTALDNAAQLSALADPLEKTADMAALADALAGTAPLADAAASLQSLAELNTLAAQLQEAAASNPDCAALQTLAQGWGGSLQQMAGMAGYAPALQQASGLAGSAEAVRSVSGLSAYADPLRQLSGLSEGADALEQLSGLSEVADGLQELTALSDAAEGVAQLQTGMQQLKTGVAQLSQGASQLPAAGQGLQDGMAELQKGTAEFRDGIHEVNEEGIDELVDFVRRDLKDLVDRLRAVRQADLACGGFTPASAGQEGSAVYLIETEGTSHS